jgi:hypothetical protein
MTVFYKSRLTKGGYRIMKKTGIKNIREDKMAGKIKVGKKLGKVEMITTKRGLKMPKTKKGGKK